MEELTGFVVKNSLALSSLAKNFLESFSLRDENYGVIYTYNNEFMRPFLRQNIKGGRCSVLNRFYKSNISVEVFNTISKKLDKNGNVRAILQKDFEYTNKHRKIIENEYDSQFNDYRDNDKEDRTEHISKELNKLPIHKKIQKLDVNNDVMLDFYGNSLYTSAMWDENSVYPKIETGFALNHICIMFM